MTDEQVEPPLWLQQFEKRNFGSLVDDGEGLCGQLLTACGADTDAVSPYIGVVGRVRVVIASADPRTVSDGMCGQLANALTNLNTFLGGAVGQEAAAKIIRENLAALDEVLESISRWPEPSVSQAIDGELAHVTELAGKISNLDASVDQEIASRVSSVKSEIDGKAEELAKPISDLNVRLDGLGTSVAKVEKRITDGDTRLNEQLASQNTLFIGQQTERDSTFTEAEKSRARALDELVADVKSNFDEAKGEIEEKRNEVLVLAQLVAETSMGGGYSKEAQDQRKLADQWRNYTVWSAIAGVALVIGAGVWTIYDHNVTWSIAGGRFVLSVVVFAVAGYCARQSAGHRENGDRARRRELELAAIGPYLEALEPEQRRAVRTALAMIWFGEGDADALWSEGSDDVAPLEQAKRLLKLRKRGTGE